MKQICLTHRGSAKAASVYKHSDVLQQTSAASGVNLYDQINYL